MVPITTDEFPMVLSQAAGAPILAIPQRYCQEESYGITDACTM